MLRVHISITSFLPTKAKLRPEEVCQEKESIEKKTQESEQKTGIIDDIKHAPTYKAAMGEKLPTRMFISI